MEYKTLILDFDNTLYPTHVYKIYENLSHSYLYFNKIDELAYKLVTKYRESGYIICIITNSNIEWLELIIPKHMPNFYKYIKETNLDIISARDFYSYIYPDNIINWKINAFQDYLLRKIMEIPDARSIKDIFVLSIGDSPYDMIATNELNSCNLKSIFELNIHTKFIKYYDAPGIDLLIKQLSYTVNHIDDIQKLEYNKTYILEEYNDNIGVKDDYELIFAFSNTNNVPKRQNMDIYYSILPIEFINIFSVKTI